MAIPADRLSTIATASLDAIVDAYTGEEPPVALPEHRYIHAGEVAWDCEQLVVAAERIFSGLPDQEQVQAVDCLILRSAVLAIHLVRCAPGPNDKGKPPTPAELTATAEIVTADAVRMFNALLAAHRAGNLGDCRSLAFEDWTAQGPGGALGGGILRVRVGLTSG